MKTHVGLPRGRLQEGGRATRIDELGRLSFPTEISARFGLRPGTPVEIEAEGDSLRLCRPAARLADCGWYDFSLANEEDCFGNAFPTCGGCLWSQGVIRCP